MKVRFLADANFNQKIVAGLLLREPSLDFALPQEMIPERMKDPDVRDLAHLSGRIVVSHDVTTMPRWFCQRRGTQLRRLASYPTRSRSAT